MISRCEVPVPFGPPLWHLSTHPSFHEYVWTSWAWLLQGQWLGKSGAWLYLGMLVLGSLIKNKAKRQPPSHRTPTFCLLFTSILFFLVLRVRLVPISASFKAGGCRTGCWAALSIHSCSPLPYIATRRRWCWVNNHILQKTLRQDHHSSGQLRAGLFLLG